MQREEVITRVSDVIDKNLEMVQKIGFLLGEGASETEKMLNSIVESFRQKKKRRRTSNRTVRNGTGVLHRGQQPAAKSSR
ncbi:MAG: hypothetical protein MZV63_05405 [Marinilabiliales bacterium]|nr:hypothetical protein [Marinilabiliales bacterium]